MTSSGRNEKYIYVEICGEKYKEVFDCPVSKKHATRSFRVPGTTDADLCGYHDITEFIPLGTGGDDIVVSEEFMNRLKKTGLTGMRFSPLKINVNQSDTEKTGDPKLYILEPEGLIFGRPLKFVGRPNQCPFCGVKPLICPQMPLSPSFSP